MQIAVVGAGNIGRTLGGKWAAAGHEVVYGLRSPEAAGTATVTDAVAGAEVVLLAVPGPAARDVLATLGGALAGKVVIDGPKAQVLAALSGAPAATPAIEPAARPQLQAVSA